MQSVPAYRNLAVCVAAGLPRFFRCIRKLTIAVKAMVEVDTADIVLAVQRIRERYSAVLMRVFARRIKVRPRFGIVDLRELARYG